MKKKKAIFAKAKITEKSFQHVLMHLLQTDEEFAAEWQRNNPMMGAGPEESGDDY